MAGSDRGSGAQARIKIPENWRSGGSPSRKSVERLEAMGFGLEVISFGMEKKKHSRDSLKAFVRLRRWVLSFAEIIACVGR